MRVFRRRWNEPRREGPYTVVRATPTAVQVEGSTTWYHLNHSTRVPRLRPRGREEQPEIDEEGNEQIEPPEREQSPEIHESEESNIDAPHFRETEHAEAGGPSEDEILPPETEQDDQGETDPGPSADISDATIAQDSGQPTRSPEPRPSTSAQSRYQPDEFLTLDPDTIADLFH